ncbi:hypothetical protein DdX_14161 [Ditylenchus destructor]|uniref:Uncharacterized protein n=1 Tax=Ditylenchus destructor TaxID=166010 RepID=A0AAD4QYU3_9BILA|nr:hypothetical protein DdX_14161 [Ditylenchus destructor]
MPEELNVEMFPSDQLCTLCHLVLKRFKSQLEGQVINEDEFKLNLALGCIQLRTPEEVLKCQKSIDPKQINRIANKANSIAALCLEAKFCKPDEVPAETSPPSVQPIEPIPDVVPIEPISNIADFVGFDRNETILETSTVSDTGSTIPDLDSKDDADSEESKPEASKHRDSAVTNTQQHQELVQMTYP